MKQVKRFKYFIIFSIIGVFCVFIDYLIYLMLWRFSGLVLISKILSSTVSVSVNYLLNSRFNFGNQQKINVKFYGQYLSVYAALILLNALINSLFYHLTDKLKLSFWLAAIIAAFTNYVTIKIFFKKINKNQSRNASLV